MMNRGMSVEQIKVQNQTHTKRTKMKQEYTKLSNGQTLLEYCVENGLNYSFVYRAINTYGKTLEDAEQDIEKYIIRRNSKQDKLDNCRGY